MPTYDYRCKACKHEFEEFQSMMDNPLRKCPKCGKLKLERLIGTGAAILFKGSGFYQTDYRSESYTSAAKAEESKASADKPASGDKSKPVDAVGKSGATPAKEAGSTGKSKQSSG